MLKDKTILLGVTGGIAAYKSAALASMLIKAGADVRVIMTEHAANFINPLRDPYRAQMYHRYL